MSFYHDFAAYYEEVFPFRERTYAFIRRHLPARGRILDAGCGTGHYCGRLAADGYDALGIDVDAEMIREARHRYPRAAFRCLDVRGIGQLDPPWDGVFCIGNVAAHVPGEDFTRFVRELRRLLTPGGAWIFQVVNWDAILDRTEYRFPDRSLGDGLTVFVRRYRDITERRVRFQTRLESNGRIIFEGEEVLPHEVRDLSGASSGGRL